MSKVLVIRKPDATIHKVSIANKASLMAHSNRLPEGQKWKFEEMDESEAEKLPFIDDSYVSAGEAQVKLKAMESEAADKDAKIKELEAMLAEKNKGEAGKKAADKDAEIKAPKA